MYSLVLAALLTTGNAVPDWGCRGGCRGCWGGCYGCWGGCMGCWGGCYGCGGGCYGCWGGGCYGCWGGCYGCGSCYGGWGGCYGCYGGCWGCYGCGGGVVISSSCYGGVMAGGAAGGGAGGAGAAGGGGSASAGGGGSGASLQELKKSVDELRQGQAQIRIDALKLTAEELRRKETDQKVDELRREINEMRLRMPPPGGLPPKNRRELPTPQPGKVFLDMPADAVVFVNEARIETASSYLTQPLQPGKEYVLSIEAVVARDGQSINRVKQLTIRAGDEVRLAFQDMDLADRSGGSTAEAAGSPARITVRVPADARLTVHGVDCPLTSDTRTFDTPALEPGQKYYYLLKAEVVRDGRTIAQTKRIDFRSGERVTVSFEDIGANVVSSR